MSSPRTEPTDRPDPAAAEKPKGALSITQLCAGALASVSAAVVASFFGVAGTLIGAAVASVISTVTAAVYTTSLSRTNERLRRVRTQVAGGTGSGTGRTAGATTADDASPATRVLPAALDPRRAPAPRRWPRVAGYAVAVFGLAMAIVTGIEIIGQQPVSALVGAQEASSSTTLGELTDDAPSVDTTPTPPGTPATTPAPSTTSETPSPGAPDGGDDAGTTAPTTSPGQTASPTAEPTGSGDEAPQTGQDPEQEQEDGGVQPTGGASPTS